jgi:hypothetical protein
LQPPVEHPGATPRHPTEPESPAGVQAHWVLVLEEEARGTYQWHCTRAGDGVGSDSPGIWCLECRHSLTWRGGYQKMVPSAPATAVEASKQYHGSLSETTLHGVHTVELKCASPALHRETYSTAYPCTYETIQLVRKYIFTTRSAIRIRKYLSGGLHSSQHPHETSLSIGETRLLTLCGIF